MSQMLDANETICLDRAMDQWRASLKRPDNDEEQRVHGALLAYARQAFALSLAPADAEPVEDKALFLATLAGLDDADHFVALAASRTWEDLAKTALSALVATREEVDELYAAAPSHVNGAVPSPVNGGVSTESEACPECGNVLDQFDNMHHPKCSRQYGIAPALNGAAEFFENIATGANPAPLAFAQAIRRVIAKGGAE